jgi:hypothetical protein
MYASVLRLFSTNVCLFSLLQAVLNTHVNLVDLVEGSKEEVRIFKTEQELSEYTRRTAKFFPKKYAVDNGILRALLRIILAP